MGWIAVLLAARHDALDFQVTPPTDEVFHYSAQVGYPKIRDYVWVGLTLLGGLAGARGWARLAGRVARRQAAAPRRAWAWAAGLACTVGAGLFGLTRSLGMTAGPVVLLMLGAVVPLLDARRFTGDAPPEFAPPAPRLRPVMAVLLMALSALWVVDPCLFTRALDGPHEGVQSLFLQGLLAGDAPDLSVTTVYGSLMTYTLRWWTALAGTDLGAIRWYFIVAVAAGTWLHLLLVHRLGGPWPVRVLAGWLMLTLSSASVTQYGWSNPLRTALPLWSVILAWEATGGSDAWRWIAAGALAAVAAAYSPEFAMAGMCAVVALAAPGIRAGGLRPWRRPAALYGAALAAGFLLLHLAMHGGGFLRGAWAGLHATYAGSRLAGAGAMPLPDFIWWSSWARVWERGWVLAWNLGVWGPVLLCGAAGTVLLAARRLDPAGRTGLILALTVFTTLAHLPVIARPLGQIAGSAPPAVLLAGLLLTGPFAAGGRRRLAAVTVGAALLAFSLVAPQGGARAVRDRLRCTSPASLPAPSPGRMGALRIPAADTKALDELVRLLRTRVRPDQRVFFAAPWHAHACFLAERAALPPYPLANLASTGADVRRILAALDAYRPPLAVMGLAGLDVPFCDEFPVLWAEVHRRYRLLRTLEGVQVFERIP